MQTLYILMTDIGGFRLLVDILMADIGDILTADIGDGLVVFIFGD